MRIRTNSQKPDEHIGPYTSWYFTATGCANPFKEYVFVCVVGKRYWSSRTAVPVYISKEYNVGIEHGPYMAGRFVIGKFSLGYLYPNHNKILLAEQAAIAHTEPEFDTELHYLRIRKYVQPGKLRKSLQWNCSKLNATV